MIRWAVAVAFALGGCDELWGISPVQICVNNDDGDNMCDEHDPCPGDTGGSADADGDDIGDDCDPHPTQMIDHRIVFEPFTMSDASWTNLGTGPWLLGATSYDHSDTSANGQIERTVAANMQPTIEVSLDATFTADLSSVGVYVENKSKVPLECRIVHRASGDELRMIVGASEDNFGGGVLMSTGPIMGIGRVRLTGGQLDSGTVRCSASYGGAPAVQIEALGGAIDPRDDFNVIGFHTIRATMSVQSFAIYSL